VRPSCLDSQATARRRQDLRACAHGPAFEIDGNGDVLCRDATGCIDVRNSGSRYHAIEGLEDARAIFAAVLGAVVEADDLEPPAVMQLQDLHDQMRGGVIVQVG